MKNVLYLRATLDWKTCNVKNYLEIAKSSSSYTSEDWRSERRPEQFLSKIIMWNETLKVDYFKYRYKLNQIQKSSIQKINNLDIIIDRNDIKILDTLDDYVLICSDDDDWFHPEVFNYLRELKCDSVAWFMSWIGYTYWKDDKFGVMFNKNAPYEYFKTYTNNFAITKSGYNKCRHIKNLLEHHHYVCENCYKTKNFDYEPIDQFLSVAVKSPASITSLINTTDNNQLLEIVNHQIKMTNILPPEIEWAQSYYNEYMKLTKLLKGLSL